jgi:hypothetical protein
MAGKPTIAWAVCCSRLFDSLAKQLLEKALGALQAFLGEDDGFRLSTRFGNVAALMQSIHRLPVKAFPGPCPSV